MYVRIGGIEQWIQFNEPAPEKPVLLFLHGGPGGTSVPASAAMKSWEAEFTLVHWDQRGSGRTFRQNGAAGCGKLTIGRMVDDGIELAEEYFAAISAPHKAFVTFEGCHHFVVMNRPELFLRELRAHVLQLFQPR